MLDREEQERCISALNKELRSVDDDIRCELHESLIIEDSVILWSFLLCLSDHVLSYESTSSAAIIITVQWPQMR